MLGLGIGVIGFSQLYIIGDVGISKVYAYDTGHEDMSDEFTYEDSYYAFEKALEIDNSLLTRSYVGDPMGSVRYQPIGKVINSDTSEYGFGKYGTGVVIDDYTFLTNHHIVKSIGTKVSSPSKVRIELGRYGSKVKKVAYAKDIIVIPNRDVVIVKTSTKLSDYVVPMKMASSKVTRAIKPGNRLYTAGYGMYGGVTNKMTKSNAYFLRYSINKTMASTKSLAVENGYSGSPIFNYKGQLVGLRSGVMDLEFWDETETVTSDYFINGTVRSAIFKYRE